MLFRALKLVQTGVRDRIELSTFLFPGERMTSSLRVRSLRSFHRHLGMASSGPLTQGTVVACTVCRYISCSRAGLKIAKPGMTRLFLHLCSVTSRPGKFSSSTDAAMYAAHRVGVDARDGSPVLDAR